MRFSVDSSQDPLHFFLPSDWIILWGVSLRADILIPTPECLADLLSLFERDVSDQIPPISLHSLGDPDLIGPYVEGYGDCRLE